MKFAPALSALCFLNSYAALAQSPAPTVSEQLKPAFAILQSMYPKVDARRFPKAPADSVWLFRAASGEDGTVEVGFEGPEVVYMVFRRGVGGRPWTALEIAGLHARYSKPLLKEKRLGLTYERFPSVDSDRIPNNMAVIARNDVGVASFQRGL